MLPETKLGAITIKKVKENTTYLNIDPNHVSKIMFDGVTQPIGIDYHVSSRSFVTGLTPEQETSFETALGYKQGTLSKYNEEYWANHENYLKIGKEGVTLNPDTNVHDRLKYYWLKAQPQVAINQKDYEDNYSSKDYLIESAEEVIKVKAVSVNKQIEAYKLLTAMSSTDKKNFLISTGLKIINESDDAINVKIAEDYIEKNATEFIEIVKSEDYQFKVKLFQAVNNGLITKQRNKFIKEDGETIGDTVLEAISYLRSPENQEFLHLLETRSKLKNKEV